MPSRPRQHELDTVSRQRFGASLPAGWIRREQQPDYGLDEQVQLVRDGQVTAFFFGAQLKGTDGLAAKDDPRWSFHTEHLRHYLELAFPVMLVLFDASNDRLYYEWVHQLFDRCSVEDLGRWYLQDTLTIHFTRSLDENAIPTIEDDTRTFYAAQSPDRAPPLDFRIASTVDARHILERVVSIVTAASTTNDLRITTTSGDGDLRIDSDGVLLIARGQRLKIPFTSPLSAELPATDIIAAVVCGAILFLAYMGRLRSSLRLLSAFATSPAMLSPIVEKALRTSPLSLLYAKPGVATEVLDAAEAFVRGGAIDFGLWVMIGFVFAATHTDSQHQRYESLLEAATKAYPRSPARATAHYSLANSLRSRGKRSQAIHHYRLAANDDPAYRSASYWWHELAGCLFGARRYRWAAYCYERSLEAPKVPAHTVPLLADALMRSGRFASAMAHLSAYVSKTERPTPFGVLLHWFVSRVLEERADGPSDRQRLMDLLREADGNPSEDQREKLLRAASLADPVAGVPHYNLGFILGRRGMAAESARHYLAAALCHESEIEAWADAILMFVQAGDPSVLFYAALATADWKWPQVELHLVRKLQGNGYSSEQTTTSVASLRAAAQEARWMFSYPVPATIRFGAPSDPQFVVEAKAFPLGWSTTGRG